MLPRKTARVSPPDRLSAILRGDVVDDAAVIEIRDSPVRNRQVLQFGQRTAHARQRRGKLRRRDDALGVHLAEEFVFGGVDQIELAIPAHRLTDAMRHQRMVLAQVGTHHQHAVEARHVGHRHAQPETAMRLVVERKIRLPQTMVDVAAAQATHQFLQQEEFLRRAIRGRQARRSGRPGCVFSLSATNSSAACQVVSTHCPSCLIIGWVRRSAVLRPS